MKKYIIKFLILLILILSSCLKNKSQKAECKNMTKAEIKPKLSNIVTYNGNALIFFTYKNHADPNVFIVQVEEKNSKVFTDNTFDIMRAVRGKCSIFTFIGYYHWNILWESKEKLYYNIEICNIDPDYNYYVKAWVSYKNMVENNRRRKTALISDSCAARNLYFPFGDKNAKGVEFKILK